MIMKKTYKKPNLTVVRLNAELPMAASVTMNIYGDETVGGSESLGNLEGEFDIWGNKNRGW